MPCVFTMCNLNNEVQFTHISQGNHHEMRIKDSQDAHAIKVTCLDKFSNFAQV